MKVETNRDNCYSVVRMEGRAHEANSHAGQGWEEFTEAAIHAVSRYRPGLVFLLWGKSAQARISAITNPKAHLILKAAHPSPYAAHLGFYGCRHFSKANAYLRVHDKTEIDWNNRP